MTVILIIWKIEGYLLKIKYNYFNCAILRTSEVLLYIKVYVLFKYFNNELR